MAALAFYSTPTTGDATYSLAALIARVRHERDVKLAKAERTIQQVINDLGPTVPNHAGCEGCKAEMQAALDDAQGYFKKHGGAA